MRASKEVQAIGSTTSSFGLLHTKGRPAAEHLMPHHAMIRKTKPGGDGGAETMEGEAAACWLGEWWRHLLFGGYIYTAVLYECGIEICEFENCVTVSNPEYVTHFDLSVP